MIQSVISTIYLSGSLAQGKLPLGGLWSLGLSVAALLHVGAHTVLLVHSSDLVVYTVLLVHSFVGTEFCWYTKLLLCMSTSNEVEARHVVTLDDRRMAPVCIGSKEAAHVTAQATGGLRGQPGRCSSLVIVSHLLLVHDVRVLQSHLEEDSE